MITCSIQIFIIVLLSFGIACAQGEKLVTKPSIQEPVTMDTTSTNSIQDQLSMIYDHALYVGIDAFAPIRGWFARKNTGYQVVSSFRVYKKIHLAVEIGQSTIVYDRLDWKATMQGLYYKVGFNWSLYEHSTDPDQMYYLGLRYTFSPYQQEVKAYPVRSFGVVYTGGGLPKIHLIAQWLEPVIGARVALFNTPIYLDASLNLFFLITSTKQGGMDPLAIPGFGEDLDKKNLEFKWAIVYKIPIVNKRR